MIPKNAIIKEARLGYEDHGILTIWIQVEYGGSSVQGFGGYSLEGSGEALLRWVSGILKTVGVDSWNELPGKTIRVKHELSKISSIGNILEEKWFKP